MAKQEIIPTRLTETAANLLARLRQAWAHQGNTLELLLPRGWPENGGVIHWRLRGAASSAPHGEVTELNRIPGVGVLTRVHAWTPASDTLLTRATLPTRSRAKIQQALPFALEDQLTADPEQLHFAYRILDDASLAVGITARSRLETWRAHLSDAGLTPASFSPAPLALPLAAGAWTVAFHDDEIWVRTGIAAGFACAATATPPAMLLAALREAREKQIAPQSLTLMHPPAGIDSDAWAASLQLPIAVQKQDFWVSHHEPVPGLNLLQGAYAPSSQLQGLVPALRPAAIMLAIWLVGSMGFNASEWWQLKKTHENLRQEMNGLFRRTFPDAQVVVDPALQMQRLRDDLQGKSGRTSGADLLPLLGSIAPVVQASPQVKLRGIQYGENKLTIDLTLPDFQAMETVKNALSARGLQVETLGANSTAAGIEGRLRLSPMAKAGT
ncbi:MAG TPA: type II secretion system protein GspL [Candidatus Methylomirabilis sp.]|nr:type II secretion system protein GspL [Candidatus Methylomirabilis sp.]